MNRLMALILLPSLAIAGDRSTTWDSPNTSYLGDLTYSSGGDFNLKLFGSQKRIAEIQQAYDLKNRTYREAEDRGTLTPFDRMSYTYNNSGFGNNTYQLIFATVKQTQAQPYADNVRAANQRGDFGAPVQYAAGALAAFTGSPIKADAGSATIVSKVDLINANASLNVVTLGGKAMIAANSRSSEPYSASLSRPLPLIDCNAGATYGSGSQTTRVFINRPIFNHLTGELTKTNGPTTSGIPIEVGYHLNYGLTF